MVFLYGVRAMLCGKVPQRPPAALLSGAVAAAHQQNTSVVAEGEAILRLVNIHAVYICGMLQSDHIGTALV